MGNRPRSDIFQFKSSQNVGKGRKCGTVKKWCDNKEISLQLFSLTVRPFHFPNSYIFYTKNVPTPGAVTHNFQLHTFTSCIVRWFCDCIVNHMHAKLWKNLIKLSGTQKIVFNLTNNGNYHYCIQG